LKRYCDYDDGLNPVRYDVHDCPFCGSKDPRSKAADKPRDKVFFIGGYSS